MPRIKISLPEYFSFSATIVIRITDLNYGGHVGNDTILSLLHEARLQYLQHFGLTELQFAGTSLIMSDVGIEYKGELFHGDTVKVWVSTADYTRASFDVYYKMECAQSGRLIAIAKTGMVCYNYESKKVVAVPDDAKQKLLAASK